MARKEGPAVAAAKAAKVARKQRQRDFMRDSSK